MFVGAVLPEAAALAPLIEPHVRAAGMALVRVQLFTAPDGLTLQVMAERPETGQLTLDDCAALSRRLSEALDAADPIPSEYRLEVSSPGIDRPLTRPHDFAEWAGHLARFKLAAPLASGRKQFDGELAGVDGHQALVIVAGETLHVPLTQVATAKLLLTDKLIAATRPLEAAGAEQELEEEED